MNGVKVGLIAGVLVSLSGCEAPREPATLDGIAERYVKLQLRVGEHEAGYIDAYYGPEAWAEDAEANPMSIADLQVETGVLTEMLEGWNTSGFSELEKKRHAFLIKQLKATDFRMRMMDGEILSFDEETAVLYDAVSPEASTEMMEAVLAELDALIPAGGAYGDGSFYERFKTFRAQFIIPTNKLAAVFEASIAGCRAATSAYLELPENERFTFEFVTDKAWSGYNWYQGGANSLIQVNVDFPIYIERAVDLGCHEGYPGHHVFNAMLEEKLVTARGWVEYSVYPLYSPQSLIAEGTANYGIQMAFPGDERRKYEVETLYPIAGIDPTNAATYGAALKLISKMRYNYTDVARRYLDGVITRDEAIAQRARYGLQSMKRAEQSIRFMEQYRGYVINYTLGMDLSDAYVRAHSDGSTESRWQAYETLLTTPMTASGLE